MGTKRKLQKYNDLSNVFKEFAGLIKAYKDNDILISVKPESNGTIIFLNFFDRELFIDFSSFGFVGEKILGKLYVGVIDSFGNCKIFYDLYFNEYGTTFNDIQSENDWSIINENGIKLLIKEVTYNLFDFMRKEMAN